MAAFSYPPSHLRQHLASEHLSHLPHSFSTSKFKSCLEPGAAVSEHHAARTADSPNLPMLYSIMSLLIPPADTAL